GFRNPITRELFARALREGTAAQCVQRLCASAGAAVFLPAGRFHAIGAGNLLVEIQQNSDTTYRVFDWNRTDETTGKPRQLHIPPAIESIDFGDVAPALVKQEGELLFRHELFEIQKWDLTAPREI